jgi:myo-inositol 2-dehydrogenase / D-chiro-inositol 1-dehydrogenase
VPGKVIGIGVIGCGRVAVERHLPVLRALDDASLVALADVNETRLHETARRFEVEQCFTDYRALLDRADVDAVAILTPPLVHAELGCEALDAGKHVFIEKPLATNLADCKRLQSRAERSSRRVMVGFNMRWHRLVLRAREIISSGALGRIKGVSSLYTHPLPEREERDWMRHRESGGGAALEEAVHHFDLWRFMLRVQVAQVFASSQCSDLYEDETMTMTGRTSDGALISGFFSLRTNGSNQLEILAERGRLALSLYRFDGLEVYSYSDYAGSIARRVRRIVQALPEIPRTLAALGSGGDFVTTYRSEWQHFIDCLRNGTMPQCTVQDGAKAVEVALACSGSAQSGRAVQLDKRNEDAGASVGGTREIA